AARLAKYPVLVLAVADEEPIQAGAAVQVVDGVVVVDRRLGKAVGAVQAAAQGAVEMLETRVVIDVGAAPLLHDGQDRRDVGVVIGGASDQDGAAAGGAEDVGARAADEQVPAAAAVERVVARAADQNVVGGAAAG